MTSNGLNGCALLIHKSALDKAGEFNKEFVYILDWMYWTELTLLGYNFYTYSETLVKNRRHVAQVSVKKRNLLRGETEQYIMQLIDRVADDEKKLQNIWLYCNQIEFKEGYSKINDMISLPFNIRIKKIRSWLLRYSYVIGRKMISILRK